MTHRERLRMVELLNQSPRITYPEIAAVMGRPAGTISSWACHLAKLGYVAQRMKKGSHYDMTQKSRSRLRLCAELRVSGMTWQQIGERIGIQKHAAREFCVVRHADQFWADVHEIRQ